MRSVEMVVEYPIEDSIFPAGQPEKEDAEK